MHRCIILSLHVLLDNNNSSWCVVGFDTLEDLQDLQDFLGSLLIGRLKIKTLT